jgi:hypothetical protein
MTSHSKAEVDPLLELFRELDDRSFEGEAEFQRAVADGFNGHLSAFPPHYSYRDAITAAVRRGWIAVERATITVRLPGTPAVGLHEIALVA